MVPAETCAALLATAIKDASAMVFEMAKSKSEYQEPEEAALGRQVPGQVLADGDETAFQPLDEHREASDHQEGASQQVHEIGDRLAKDPWLKKGNYPYNRDDILDARCQRI